MAGVVGRRGYDRSDRRKLGVANRTAKAGSRLLNPVQIVLEVLWVGTLEEVGPKLPIQGSNRALHDSDDRIGCFVRIVGVHAHDG